MQIIFWQNIISPHQSFLIRELAKCHEVTLAVLEEISEERIKQGWKKPDTGKAKIVLLENMQIAFNLYDNNKNAIQLFSGISNYKIIKSVFRKLDNDVKIGVIVEAGSSLGWKRHFRKLIYFLKYIRYNRKINFIFAMGSLGVNWYHSVGFSKNKLYKFQYFTELPDYKTIKESCNDNKLRLLFIGQLIDRKNIQDLVDSLINLKEMNYILDIVGDGPLKIRLQNLVEQHKIKNKIIIHGNMENDRAMELLSKSDYLVLPSKFDGWGAVINEALSRGVKVITNENCGASYIVNELQWGIVYENNSNTGLENAVKSAIANFKRETTISRKRIALEFANNYSYNIVDKFEEILSSK